MFQHCEVESFSQAGYFAVPHVFEKELHGTRPNQSSEHDSSRGDQSWLKNEVIVTLTTMDNDFINYKFKKSLFIVLY